MRVPYASGRGQLKRDEQLRHFQHIFQFLHSMILFAASFTVCIIKFSRFLFFSLDKKREGGTIKKSSSTFFPKTFDIIARVHNLKANFFKGSKKRRKKNNTNIAFL